MGSGFVVIVGFLLAIAMVFVIVFARWNQVENSSSVYSMNSDKPKIESSVDESGYVAVILPDAAG
ncbi:MAG: hypothetical protein IJK83_01470 [Clostridiales bacterium]|nr:hypothetical protein [Clostridiales bacterium]MBR2821822.1 hypothetical protein [Clostridiales bacterium]